MFTLILIACINTNYNGRYFSYENRIEICKELPFYEKKRVLTHEIGHRVWYKKFDEEDRKEFEIERAKYNWISTLYYHPSPGIKEDFAILFQRTFYGKYTEYPELKKWLKNKIKIISKK